MNVPLEVGGRSTELVQVALSVIATVRQAYPMNDIPQDVLDACMSMKSACEIAEACMAFVFNEMAKEDK